MQENIKQVIVKNTVRKEFKTVPIFQYDVGHILSFEGFNLPEAFEVHYAFSESGDAVTQVGNNNQVAVPDALVQDGRGLYAWLYISDEETGLTKFVIQIPVTRRAKPTDQVPSPVEQSEIQQAIAALNTGVTKAETAAENAEQSEENASQYAENAYNSSVAAANSAESAEGDARTATEKSQIAVNAAETATRKAQEASESAEGLAEAVRTAQEAKQTAVNKATEASQSASVAAQNAQEALSSAQAAEGSANDADTAKRGAETARDAAQGYAGNASTSAQAAETAKDTAVQKAGEASQSATNAAGSAQAAAQTAAQFEEDITDLKSDIEDIAQEDTAQTISGLVAQITVLVQQIAEEGGSAGDLNGFSLSMGAGGEVILSYVNPEDEEDTASAVMPTGTTQEEILSVMQDITGSLKIWAGGAA